MAIVYHGRVITVFRNGVEYAPYSMPEAPQAFGPEAVVLLGRRHSSALAPA
jgi:hypothetical protein